MQQHSSPGGAAMMDHTSPGGKQRVCLLQLGCLFVSSLTHSPFFASQRDGLQKPNTLSTLTIKQLSALIPDPAGSLLFIFLLIACDVLLHPYALSVGDGFTLQGRGDLSSVRILGRVVDLLDEVRVVLHCIFKRYSLDIIFGCSGRQDPLLD